MRKDPLQNYFSYADVLEFLNHALTLFPPDVHADIEVYGKSPEGRDLLAFHIWPKGSQQRQPVLWCDANMHAAELIGTNTILAQILKVAEGLKGPHKSLWSDVNYIFVPRVCPDGAERYFTTGHVNRSIPRDRRTAEEKGPHWDVMCLVPKEPRPELKLPLYMNPQRVGVMRQKSPGGWWTEDSTRPGLMRRRCWGDTGPFYDIFPEGRIAHFDGVHIPPAHKTGHSEVDLNRNFPIAWNASWTGDKGGFHALSEVESRALAAHAAAHAQIYFWMNYHTFGGVYIRPPDTGSDADFHQLDRSLYELLDKEWESLTGYPAVSGVAEFQYQPNQPLPGTLSSFAWYSFGCYAYVCELWDLPKRMGHTERPFIQRYVHWCKDDWQRFFDFDKEQNSSLVFGHPWKVYHHPQLGEVEISEMPAVFGIQNPPQNRISEVVLPQLDVLEKLVHMAPRLEWDVTPGNEARTWVVHVKSTGFIPPHVSHQRQKIQGSPQIHLQLLCGGESVDTAFLPPLSGWAPLNTGWIDFAGNGSSQQNHVRVTLRLPLSAHDTDPLSIRLAVPGGAVMEKSIPL